MPKVGPIDGWRRLMRCLLADVLHRHAETDRRGGLALAERRRRDRRDDDVLGLGAVGELVDGLQPDLGQLVAVRLEQMRADPHLRGDLGERQQRGCPGDL